MIHVGDLTVILAVAETFLERRRRVVRKMRIIEVEPAEELFLVIRIEPGEESRYQIACPPLRSKALEDLLLLKCVVVHTKPAIKPEARVECEGGNKRRRFSPGFFKYFGKRRDLAAQNIKAVVVHPVIKRRCSS